MDAGKLDRCIRIETRSQSQDSFGEQIETFAVLESCRAQVIPTTAVEPFQGDQYNAQRRATFVIRYRTGIDETSRIVYNGDTYDITGLFEIGRRQWLEIQAFALVPTA